MTTEFINKMDQWRTTMALMDISFDDIWEDWDDEEHFYGLIRQLEEVDRRTSDPNYVMKAVLQTRAMGITSDDIDSYNDYLEELEEKKREAERQKLIDENPALLELTNKFKFQFIDSKQYPNQTHFTFVDSKGLEFKCRLFRKGWHIMRVWFNWTDAKGKKQRMMWDTDFRAHLQVPSNFPEEYRSYSSYTTNPSICAKIVAYKISKRKMYGGFVYPKR